MHYKDLTLCFPRQQESFFVTVTNGIVLVTTNQNG